jgi:hypothetical protein
MEGFRSRTVNKQELFGAAEGYADDVSILFLIIILLL